jgi:outer membrane lipoprotein-sorting protein
MRAVFYFCLLPFAFCLLLSSCAKKLPPLPPPIMPSSIPAELSTEALYQLIKQRVNAFQNFRGVAKTRLVSNKDRYRFTEVVVLEKPDLFRLETLGFLNQPALFVTSNGKSLALYSKRDQKYYSGLASQANLFKLTGLNMTTADVVRVLSGNPPDLEKINSIQSTYLPDQKAYRIELISTKSQRKQLILVDATTKALSQVETFLFRDNTLLLKITWEDYRNANGYAIPGKIIIDKPLDKTRVELTYKSFEVNQNLDSDLFSLKPPENATVYLLDNPKEEPLQDLAPLEEFKAKDPLE